MVIGRVGEGANRLRKQKARVLKTDEKQMTMTCSEILKIVLPESKSMIKKLLSNIITAASKPLSRHNWRNNNDHHHR